MHLVGIHISNSFLVRSYFHYFTLHFFNGICFFFLSFCIVYVAILREKCLLVTYCHNILFAGFFSFLSTIPFDTSHVFIYCMSNVYIVFFHMLTVTVFFLLLKQHFKWYLLLLLTILCGTLLFRLLLFGRCLYVYIDQVLTTS